MRDAKAITNAAVFLAAIFLAAVFLFLIAAPYEFEIARNSIPSLDLCKFFLQQNVRERFVLGGTSPRVASPIVIPGNFWIAVGGEF